MELASTYKTPALAESTALLLAVLFTVLFVAPFYLSPTLRATPLNRRDSPTNIQARVYAVGITCLLAFFVAVSVHRTVCQASVEDIFRLTGLYPVNPLDIARSLLLVHILFVGPLYERLIVDGEWRELGLRAFRYHWWDTWPGFRNQTVAPVGEEFVFRAMVISLYLHTDASGAAIVMRSPLVFGVAHVHHLVEFLQHHTPPGKRWPGLRVLAMGLLRSAFQFAYTSLFGFFAAFVFLRTGSLWTAIAVHSFCNFMGFPRVTGKVGQFRDERGDGWDNLGVEWTVVYYVLLLAGAAGFYGCLWRLTESTNALISF